MEAAMEDPVEDASSVGMESVSTDLPSQWVRQWDETTGKFFITNSGTGESSWEGPPDEEQRGDHELEADASDQIVASTGVWIAQYDPSAARAYYYHTATGATQWELPDGFVDDEYRDDKMDGAVRIQSAFRSKKARDRVQQLIWSSRSTSASSGMSSEPSVWRQHFDPRSQQYYYHNIETGEVAWERPQNAGNLLADTDSQGDSATKIQCVFRKRAASKCVEAKKQLIKDLTSDGAINQKLQDIMRAMDEIDREVDARRVTLDSSVRWTQLQASLNAWTATASRIRDRVLEHHHHALLVQQLHTTGAERLATVQQFHDAMAATRSDCLSLLKSILLSDSQFLEIDTLRLNDVYQQFQRCKNDSLFSIPEKKVRLVIRIDELETTHATAEECLRKAMGLTDFSAGEATARSKTYSDWREQVQLAVMSVHQLHRMMRLKRDLLELYEQRVIERKEAEEMVSEDQLSRLREQDLRNAEQKIIAHAQFLRLCRERWEAGLRKREQDTQALQMASQAIEQKRLEESQRIDHMKQNFDQARRRVKLSIWEATREGTSVDTMRGMIYAEIQKARQNGYEFDIRSARSNRGETLVQIACWGGHTELVSFLLDEGADLHAVDSISNGFTLLHDAARRGDPLTTRLLVNCGLKQDIVDRSGDTPLHWAVRNNHYETVHTLLGAYMHRQDPDHNECALRAVRTRNQRGRRPIDLAKSECMKRLLSAFDEGRICSQLFHSRSNSKPFVTQPHGRRMTEATPSQISPQDFIAAGTGNDNKRSHVLTKASTTPALSSLKAGGQDEPHPAPKEDEFGAINLLVGL